MQFGYYPGWSEGPVRTFLEDLKKDGSPRKAEARLWLDLLTLQEHWPATLNVTVKPLKGHEPLWELKREYRGIAYRLFFCVHANRLWLLHAIEKKSAKTPANDLHLAARRMADVLTGKAIQP